MDLSIFNVLLSLVLAVVLQKMVFFLLRWVRAWRATKQFQGFPGTKLISGDLKSFASVDDYMEKTNKFIYDTGAKVFPLWIYFMYPAYVIAHPDHAKRLLKSSAPKDENVGAVYTMLRPWIGKGLLAHPGGKEWERNRHLLTPAFHFDILKDYVNVFNEVVDDFLKLLSSTAKGQSVEISTPITIATLDSLLRCALSYRGNIQETGQDHPYVKAVHTMSGYYNDRLMNPFWYPDFVYFRTKPGKHMKELCDYVHRFAEDIIKKRKQSLKQADVNRNDEKKEEYRKRKLDFLDILLTAKDDQGQGLTDLEIRSEVDTFMFAGHDTTSAAIIWAVHALAKYPDEQKKIYEEIAEVIGDRPVECDDLSNLTYQALFIKEVLRMYSIVPVIARLLIEPMTLDGATIPANTLVELNIQAINHRADVWPDHDVFRPERFEEPSGKGRDPFCFIPFSAGSRNCIGQNFATNEIKVFITRLLQKYRIELDQTHNAVPTLLLVMRPKDGLKVFLHLR